MDRSISNENALPRDLFQFIVTEITIIVNNPKLSRFPTYIIFER